MDEFATISIEPGFTSATLGEYTNAVNYNVNPDSIGLHNISSEHSEIILINTNNKHQHKQ